MGPSVHAQGGAIRHAFGSVLEMVGRDDNRNGNGDDGEEPNSEAIKIVAGRHGLCDKSYFTTQYTRETLGSEPPSTGTESIISF